MSDPLQVDARELGLWLDARRMQLAPEDLEDPSLAAALEEMAALEAGAIANPDEGRQVGHYWLRAPALAPAGQADAIRRSWTAMESLVDRIPAALSEVVWIGIGGSALGPQLLVDALGVAEGGRRFTFLDNTDPAGLRRALAAVDPAAALFVVVSKSGGTRETLNALAEARAACAEAGVALPPRAVAVTGEGSALDERVKAEGWIGALPLWSWVGGRTSVTGMVGLLALALADRPWRRFLEGAAACDVRTRRPEDNPALLMALAWHRAGEGRGRRAMVSLPYKDALLLLSRYLQQLVMESLGKRLDRDGRPVRQGLTVYGNKGSTDQHAFVQQLRDGPDDAFVTFICTLEDDRRPPLELSPGVTSGDYLAGFMLGTRRALTAVGRRSMTLTLDRLDAFHLGALVALFERAVGLYASMINVNAYDQPGVEAGKVAAAEIIMLQRRLMAGEPLPETEDVELLRRRLRAQGRI